MLMQDINVIALHIKKICFKKFLNNCKKKFKLAISSYNIDIIINIKFFK